MSIDIDIDIDSIKDFNRNSTLTIITCFVIDFDNSDNALKVFSESVINSSKR